MLTKKLLLFGLPLLSIVVSGDSVDPNPFRILADADRLAKLYNWPEASSRYVEAEKLLRESG